MKLDTPVEDIVALGKREAKRIMPKYGVTSEDIKLEGSDRGTRTQKMIDDIQTSRAHKEHR